MAIQRESPLPHNAIVRREFFVYILASKHRALYIGVTNNLERRLEEHWQGPGTSFSKRYATTILVYAEQAPTANDAIAREKQLKAWSRKKKIALIEQANPNWLDLTRL